MRALFILNSQDTIYGASRSVSTLIRSLDADIDLIFPLSIKNARKIDKDFLTENFGTRIRNIYILPQPSRYTVLTDDTSFAIYVKSALKELLVILCKWRYHKIFRKGNYDFIHLNSAVQYPLLEKNYPMFLHVRETVRKERRWIDRNFYHYLNKAHGVFFISQLEKDLCIGVAVPQIVLTNPFDQRKVQLVEYKDSCVRFSLDGTETVYSILGNIRPEKGVLFVIKAFQKAKLENAVLLIAGRGASHRNYEDAVYKIVDMDPRIRYVGELEDTAPIYRVSDYIVRGEDVSGGGRTTYEGLYSGCGSIVPYQTEEDKKLLNLTEDMRKRVEFYKLRNEEDLIRAFQNTQFHKMTEREYSSNTEQYVTSFLSFINKNNGKKSN